MTRELSYEETIELEKNISVKNEAEKIYSDFLKNIKLSPANYKKGQFLFWSDQYNEIYFTLMDEEFVFQCRFLHESYDVKVTPSGIFDALKRNYKGVEHLRSVVSKPITNH